jgi:translation initiation factor 1 (eIF-1/SUI1)
MFPKDYKVQLLLKIMGRKKITFINGWDISEDDLKEHMKNIKKKNCCNGSYKCISDSGKKTNNFEIQFQGDLIDFLKEYLINSGIDSDNIIIKGV